MKRLLRLTCFLTLAIATLSNSISQPVQFASDGETHPQGEPRKGGGDRNPDCIAIYYIDGLMIIVDVCTGEIIHIG